MRVMSVNMAGNYRGLYAKQNNPSFGSIEDASVKNHLTYKLPDFEESDLEKMKPYIDYIANVAFVTAKMAKFDDGKNFVYVVMNKNVTDKHKNKNLFDSLVKDGRDYYDGFTNLSPSERELMEKEPDFFEILDSEFRIINLYDDLEAANDGNLYNIYRYDNDEEDKKNKSSQQQEDWWWEANMAMRL